MTPEPLRLLGSLALYLLPATLVIFAIHRRLRSHARGIRAVDRPRRLDLPAPIYCGRLPFGTHK